MLVVSNIDLTCDLPILKPSAFLEATIKDFTLNINDDYRYLKTGYYVSLHAEILGNFVMPTSENIIDANRNPILLLRASKAGIPTMPYLVTDSVKKIATEYGFPVVAFAVNPFVHEGFKIARNRSALYKVMKSLSMNYKFTICAQPLMGELVSVKSVFGRCELEEKVQKISEKVYDLFRIPICKLHIQRVGEKAYLCGLESLKREKLSPSDLNLISEQIRLISNQGGPFSVKDSLFC